MTNTDWVFISFLAAIVALAITGIAANVILYAINERTAQSNEQEATQ